MRSSTIGFDYPIKYTRKERFFPEKRAFVKHAFRNDKWFVQFLMVNAWFNLTPSTISAWLAV